MKILSIAIVGLAFIGLGYYLIKAKWEGLKIVAAEAIIVAEELYKSKQGQAKFKAVLEKVQSKVPLILKPLFTEEKIGKMIESILKILQNQFKGTVEKQVKILDTATKLHKTKNDIMLDLEEMKEQVEKIGSIKKF